MNYICINFIRGIIIIIIIPFVCCCESFVDVELTNSKVTSTVVFGDDNTATSAMIGIYYEMSTNVITRGEVNSLSRLAGLSSDELVMVNELNGAIEFERNELTSDNPNINSLWSGIYKVIYEANSMIEGLERSDKLSSSVKSQLLGEARFIRAFCHFYLLNFFGDVPVITSTDYKQNASAERAPVSVVYEQILSDLLLASDLLSNDYQTLDRIRPNSSAAKSLLAKVYLYLEDWDKAEKAASDVLDDDKYEIVSDFDKVFLKDSREAIWQIAPPDISNVTYEALYYVITSSPQYLVLRDTLVKTFESMDGRLINWIGETQFDGRTYYYPNKYKLQDAGLPTAEYSIVLRLSEMYLIRSEARAKQGEVVGGISDLDVVRRRAGLNLVGESDPGIDADSLLLMIQNERKWELFTEWGNRWFDLKRLSDAPSVLAPLKSGFDESDELYPIPQIERDRNTNLGNQNPGY